MPDSEDHKRKRDDLLDDLLQPVRAVSKMLRSTTGGSWPRGGDND